MSLKVFISYSHDSDEHREKVLALSERLRGDGVETILDRYVNGSPEQGWPRWMLDGLDAADRVLVVCTETYYRRFRGHEAPGKGKGVDWEGAIITQSLYNARSRTLKFVPVFFPGATDAAIPEPLRGQSFFRLSSDAEYDSLYDFLLDQAGVAPSPVGPLKVKPREKAEPLTFPTAPETNGACAADLSRIQKYAPAELIGREAELKLLDDAWAKVQRHETPRPHVLTFVALGGEGKTSLVAKWAAGLAAQDWPGCDAVFAWSFYSQGTREQLAASSDIFLKEALNFFGDADDKQFAATAASAHEKGQRLARIVGRRRSLLILDGLEPLQYAPTSPTPGELKDQGIAALLKGLAANSLGLCVVTTRYSLPDLRAFWQSTAPEKELKRLPKEGGVALLRSFRTGPEGNQKAIRGSQGEFEQLVEDLKGHALSLNLIGSYLLKFHAGDIRKRDHVRLEQADRDHHAFHIMDAYALSLASTPARSRLGRLFRGKEPEAQVNGRRALAVLRLLGLFDRPAGSDCLNVLWNGPAIPGLTEPLSGLNEGDLNNVLAELDEARLLTVHRDFSDTLLALDTHPHIREYFGKQLREKNPAGWRAAHQRLYEHLCATTKEGVKPALEQLQPLYQAVAHGCQAGLQQRACDDVYYARIARKGQAYAVIKLGAFGSDLGAVACFFDEPWRRVSTALTEADQAWLLSCCAFYLRALGRLMEALEPMRVSGEMAFKAEDWKQAAIRYSNLSELELTLGEVAGAVVDAEQSVTYADRSGDPFLRMAFRTTHADALHQAGRRPEAETLFREAEEMQRAREPEEPLLYSVQGFQYCDVLLAGAERAAWQTGLPIGSPASANNSALSASHSVSKRAAQALKVSERNNWLLAIGLDYLTLGRAALYEAILAASVFSPHGTGLEHIEAAVSGLRSANSQHHLPRGLLTRAWLRYLTGNRLGPESAQADLDEAWEIAERGPMKLFLVDIHLYRARLFFRETTYPWESPQADLAAAEKIIRHETKATRPDGTVIRARYARLDEELADAKRAILGA